MLVLLLVIIELVHFFKVMKTLNDRMIEIIDFSDSLFIRSFDEKAVF